MLVKHGITLLKPFRSSIYIQHDLSLSQAGKIGKGLDKTGTFPKGLRVWGKHMHFALD